MSCGGLLIQNLRLGWGPDSKRPTLGYALMLNGAAVSCKSKRQPVVALSTAEAEFIAASSMVQEVI
jgi:hypothetical protein